MRIKIRKHESSLNELCQKFFDELHEEQHYFAVWGQSVTGVLKRGLNTVQCARHDAREQIANTRKWTISAVSERD